jgi:hypothetical protein
MFSCRATFYLKRTQPGEWCMDSRLEELKRSLSLSVDGMSTEQLKWHPAEKWCAAEVLEHLYLSYTGTIKAFEKVIASGEPLVTRPSLKQRVQTIVAVGFGYLRDCTERTRA